MREAFFYCRSVGQCEGKSGKRSVRPCGGIFSVNTGKELGSVLYRFVVELAKLGKHLFSCFFAYLRATTCFGKTRSEALLFVSFC